ncbi:MAG TPA: hypothetical protein VK843_10115 [Planctomycetota bacterium]|nr:hypothetical protein [Planctomycetota bacterium]
MGRILLASLLLLLAGCKGKLSKPPEVESETEKGSTELVFLLGDHKIGAGGEHDFSAKGLLHGRPVGFDLHFEPWFENPPGYINMSTWESKATIRSRGGESNELLRFLDQRYGADVAPRAMASSIECQALVLWEPPAQFSEPVSVVLIFPCIGYDQMRESSLWLDLRLEEGRIRLREKDPSLRRELIKALTQREGD